MKNQFEQLGKLYYQLLSLQQLQAQVQDQFEASLAKIQEGEVTPKEVSEIQTHQNMDKKVLVVKSQLIEYLETGKIPTDWVVDSGQPYNGMVEFTLSQEKFNSWKNPTQEALRSTKTLLKG